MLGLFPQLCCCQHTRWRVFVCPGGSADPKVSVKQRHQWVAMRPKFGFFCKNFQKYWDKPVANPVSYSGSKAGGEPTHWTYWVSLVLRDKPWDESGMFCVMTTLKEGTGSIQPWPFGWGEYKLLIFIVGTAFWVCNYILHIFQTSPPSLAQGSVSVLTGGLLWWSQHVIAPMNGVHSGSK